MKKIFTTAITTVLCISAISVVTFAKEIKQDTNPKTANTVITTSKAVEYTVIIPESGQAVYGVEDNSIGSVEFMSGNLEPNSKVTVELTNSADFVNSKDANEKIPYSVESNGTTFVKTDFYENTVAGAKVPLSVKITNSDWENAKAGNYSATLTFTVSYTAQ